MKKLKPKEVVSLVMRFTLTIALLVVVWRHSHWSVALTLSCLSIANELAGWVQNARWARTVKTPGWGKP